MSQIPGMIERSIITLAAFSVLPEFDIDSRYGIVYNTNMVKLQVVLDTNVIISALRSQQGASYKLLMLVGRADFEINLSVPLLLEYEDVTKRLLDQIPLTETDVNDILDYLCRMANQRELFYLWRPFLKAPKDDMVLELAVSGQCQAIIAQALGREADLLDIRCPPHERVAGSDG